MTDPTKAPRDRSERNGLLLVVQNRLRKLMDERGMSGTDLARACGLPGSTISSILSPDLGRAPSLVTIGRLSRGLKVPTDYFFNADELFGNPPGFDRTFAKFIEMSDEAAEIVIRAFHSPHTRGPLYYCPRAIPLILSSPKILMCEAPISEASAITIIKNFEFIRAEDLSGTMLISPFVLDKIIARKGIYASLPMLEVHAFTQRLLTFESSLRDKARLSVCDFFSEAISPQLVYSENQILSEYNGGWLQIQNKRLAQHLARRITAVADRGQSVNNWLSHN